MNINIYFNNGASQTGALMSGTPQQAGSPIVPVRVQKDFGLENAHLVPSDQRVQVPTSPVSFGGLGSYSYGQPKKMPCPPRNLPPPPQPIPCRKISGSAKLTRDDVKEVAIKWAKSKCCRSAKPFEAGHITDVRSCNAFEYKLETFTETRSIGCNYGQASSGQTIDAFNPNSASIPNLWLWAAQPSQPFANSLVRLPIPHTELLQPCFRCQQFGFLKCSNCKGVGTFYCLPCRGTGRLVTLQKCFQCGGSGRNPCIRCSGGRVECDVCRTSQWVKWFLEVVIEYFGYDSSVNHVDTYVNERNQLPDDLVKEHRGDILVQAEGAQLMPIQDCESNDLNQNSMRLIQKAAQVYSQENQILQRHVLKSINVTECTCSYETKPFKFWIVGEEQLVHCPDYPPKCACCII